jgi:hypothetical protein
MTEQQTPEARNIKTEGGNYNERIGKHYIHAETVNIYETAPNPSAPSTTPPVTSSKIPPKSSVHQVALLSEQGINYSKLRDLLVNEQWKDADNETEMLILEAAHRKGQLLNVESIQKLPKTDLCTIDQLWVTSSRGRFGFSVQKEIWEYHQKNTDNEYELYCLFGNSVGWRKNGEWLWYKDITFNLSAPKGHFPQRGLEAVLIGKTIQWKLNTVWMSSGLGENLFSEFFYRVSVCNL